MKVIEFENAIVIVDDDRDYEMSEFLANIIKAKQLIEPQEILTWHDEVQGYIEDLLYSAVKRCAIQSTRARSGKLREALIILQGGQ